MLSALQVTAVEYSYQHIKALDKVSLTVNRGRFVALLGANGAGKTTLFSIITGLYSAQAGSVSVMDHSMESEPLKALAGLGVVFQKSTLDMDLTVEQNLRYASDLQGLSGKHAKEKIDAAISLHSMADYSSRKVGALSGGQKRRVELARALLHNPTLLLLDEPTVGLDMASRTEFVAHVKSLCQSQQTGVLWATHLMDEVGTEDEVYILDSGNIVIEGGVGELVAQHGAQDIGDLFQRMTAKSTLN